MTEKKPGDIMVPPSGGVIRETVLRLKLILRLMGDSRVNFLLKVLPVASLGYLFWPVDLVSIIPAISALDDIAIVGLGAYLFVELCPQDVVQEHMKELSSNVSSAQTSDEVVDAESRDISDK